MLGLLQTGPKNSILIGVRSQHAPGTAAKPRVGDFCSLREPWVRVARLQSPVLLPGSSELWNILPLINKQGLRDWGSRFGGVRACPWARPTLPTQPTLRRVVLAPAAGTRSAWLSEVWSVPHWGPSDL